MRAMPAVPWCPTPRCARGWKICATSTKSSKRTTIAIEGDRQTSLNIDKRGASQQMRAVGGSRP